MKSYFKTMQWHEKNDINIEEQSNGKFVRYILNYMYEKVYHYGYQQTLDEPSAWISCSHFSIEKVFRFDRQVVFVFCGWLYYQLCLLDMFLLSIVDGIHCTMFKKSFKIPKG